MPEVVRIYPDGHTVRASVSGWDIEQHIRISSQCRPSCAHVVDGKIRTSGRVSQDTIRAAVVPQSIFENFQKESLTTVRTYDILTPSDTSCV